MHLAADGSCIHIFLLKNRRKLKEKINTILGIFRLETDNNNNKNKRRRNIIFQRLQRVCLAI